MVCFFRSEPLPPLGRYALTWVMGDSGALFFPHPPPPKKKQMGSREFQDLSFFFGSELEDADTDTEHYKWSSLSPHGPLPMPSSPCSSHHLGAFSWSMSANPAFLDISCSTRNGSAQHANPGRNGRCLRRRQPNRHANQEKTLVMELQNDTQSTPQFDENVRNSIVKYFQILPKPQKGAHF